MLKTGQTAVLIMGLGGTAIQGVIAYLLFANAPKWEGFWKGAGYVGGGLFAVGAAWSLFATIAGTVILGGVREAAKETRPLIEQKMQQKNPTMDQMKPLPGESAADWAKRVGGSRLK